MSSNKRNNLSVVMKPNIDVRMKIHRLPEIEGLSEGEIKRASVIASGKIKRRVAQVSKFPPRIIKKPGKPVKMETEMTVATEAIEILEQKYHEKILSRSELNAYMDCLTKVQKIRTEVAVPRAYSTPASSSGVAKVKAIKEKKKAELKERALSKKRARQLAKQFIL